MDKIIINILTKRACLPTTLISDRGPAFVSQVIKEMSGVLGITLRHDTAKHAETILMPEQSHASIKQALKIETGEQRALWHENVVNAVLNYNTFYHTSNGCEPSRDFGWHYPYNILDSKLRIHPQQ